MARFTSFDGHTLEFSDTGAGDPVVLLHGFAADSRTNWGRSPVVPTLGDAGRRVILVDARGHGRSDKPHDPEAYGDAAMARDVQALLDHLDIERVDLVGYSMGAMVAMATAAREPRVRAIVVGGVGGNVLKRGGVGIIDRPAVAAALETDDPNTITDPSARAFRSFADATGADRVALAAIQHAGLPWTGRDVDTVDVPAIVIVGDRDTLAGSADELAAALPHARAVTVSGDHMSAPLDPAFAKAAVEFLDEQG